MTWAILEMRRWRRERKCRVMMMWMVEFSKFYVRMLQLKWNALIKRWMRWSLRCCCRRCLTARQFTVSYSQLKSIQFFVRAPIDHKKRHHWMSIVQLLVVWMRRKKNCISRRMPSNQEIIKIQSLFLQIAWKFSSSGMFSCAVECNTEFNVVCRDGLMEAWNFTFSAPSVQW